MKKYEFCFIIETFETTVDQLTDEFNRLGSEGWQFCHRDGGRIWFQREVNG